MGQHRAALRAKARRRREHRRRVLALIAKRSAEYIKSRLSAPSFMERLFPVVTDVIEDEAQFIPESEPNEEK